MSPLYKLKIVQSLEETISRHSLLVETSISINTKKMYIKSTEDFKRALAAYIEENPGVRI